MRELVVGAEAGRGDMRLPSCGRRCARRVRGFTLIEMLVVFSLLALLLSIALPRFSGVTDRAGEKARAQNLATLRDAIDKFKADQGRYPTELAELVGKHYLRSLPLDPVSGSSEWTAIPHPAAAEPGVYDVGPPGAQPVIAAPSAQAVPAPAASGSLPVVARP